MMKALENSGALEMNYPSALAYLARARRPDCHGVDINFVSPAVSVICAASAVAEHIGPKFRPVGDAAGYAVTNGLTAALAGDFQIADGAGQQGLTYSRLSRLTFASEVDRCNQIVGDLIYRQFGENNAASNLVKVVGELHDNVASHANGAGFSCAQVYAQGNGKRLEFSIADIGCGMLENARRANAALQLDHDAIRWCFQKGNTSAANTVAADPWAQRIPDDALGCPIPGPVYRDEGGNHHAGLGLYHLRRLVRFFRGKMWIWSGSAQVLLAEGRICSWLSDLGPWRGVVIEFEVFVPDDRLTEDSLAPSPELEEVGRILGF